MSTPAPSAAAPPPPAAPKPERAGLGGRLPSLNQLAARINMNAPAGSAATNIPSTRPRLAASILRTGSVASAASTTDSIAVNPPSTRAASPAARSASPSHTATPTIPEDDVASHLGEPLTAEHLERLNQETIPERRGVTVGYKNIPSLDAITARLAKARSLSIDGTAKPPEAEMIEDPKSPGVHMKAPEHPLQYTWTMYHDTKAKVPFTPNAPVQEGPTGPFSVQAPESGEYEAGLTVIGEFDTVESFCRYFNWLKPPSKLERNSNYHLFKAGIKPMWEDEANANGGKWVLTMKNNPVLLDRCWSWLTMALVGEELEEGDEICGAVVSLRSKVDRIQVWTRSKDDLERLNAIGKRFVKLLDVSEADGIGLEFQYNSEDRPPLNKFLSIQAMPSTSFRSTFGNQAGHGRAGSLGSNKELPFSPVSAEAQTPVSANGGAFGNFGVGGIGRGSGWRGGKRG